MNSLSSQTRKEIASSLSDTKKKTPKTHKAGRKANERRLVSEEIIEYFKSVNLRNWKGT